MLIEVILKRVYGVERFYPVNAEAKLLCKLLDSNTLTKEKLILCKELWEVTIKVEDYKLD